MKTLIISCISNNLRISCSKKLILTKKLLQTEERFHSGVCTVASCTQLLGGSVVKNLSANAGGTGDRFHPWMGKIPWRRKW